MHTDVSFQETEWLAAHGEFDAEPHETQLLAIFRKLQELDTSSSEGLRKILARHPRNAPGQTRTFFSKHELVQGYRILCEQGGLRFDPELLRRLQIKPTRTLSGVAPVTVLTKPFPCPGECVFCPTARDMPKSYLPDEPGAMRASYHGFDPFEQTRARIRALGNIGHPTDKIELLILGGTWSYYESDYQRWFVHRCLDALNEAQAPSLEKAQQWNESAPHRCVGLAVETRPDWITTSEIARLRHLGVTKVQLGLQSLDDEILAANGRGHTVQHTQAAFRLLRLAGFKIAAHWMPNLLGATPESDRSDFRRLWENPSFRPDELKIYPCALLEHTPLAEAWLSGAYIPYDGPTLIQLVTQCKAEIPKYCRLNRMTRDIPASNIVAGNRRANLRQIAQAHLAKQGIACRCIRCREVRKQSVDPASLHLESIIYPTDVTREYFLSAVTPSGQIAGFLRLSLPNHRLHVKLPSGIRYEPVFDEIKDCGMIRQLHVYGPALALGASSSGEAQHSGIGSGLIEYAVRIARASGFRRLAVIAATGTRHYYRRKGFRLNEYYMTVDL